MLITNIY